MPLPQRPQRPSFKNHEVRKLQERISDLDSRLAEETRQDSPRYQILQERKNVYVKMLEALQADE